LEKQRTVISGKITSCVRELISRFAKDVCNAYPLIESNFQGDLAASFQMGRSTCGYDAIGIETIVSAIERQKRIEIAHIPLKAFNVFGRYIGRI